MENVNQEAPDPEKKKDLKSFTFTRSLQNDEKTPQGPKIEREGTRYHHIRNAWLILLTLLLYRSYYDCTMRTPPFVVSGGKDRI